MRKERVIFKDYLFFSREEEQEELEGAREILTDCYEEKDVSEDKVFDFMLDHIREWWEDESRNLDIDTNRLIAIADLGLWNGRVSGYKLLNHNLSEILDYNGGVQDIKVYSDGYNIRQVGAHHDGRNYVLFREFKRGLSQTQIDNFLNKIYEGKCTSKDISRYTTSLLPYVKEVYGW